MITEVIPVTEENKETLDKAAVLIKRGEVVAIPTETVYGLAANAFDENAVTEIFKAKGRPADNPLIVHIAVLSQLDELVSEVPDSVALLAERFWPGPLTLVLKKSGKVPDIVTAGLDSVAIRMPSHPVALAFIEACKVPLAAPSANLSGSPSPTQARHVYDDLNGKIPMILDGGTCAVGVESTVLSLTGDIPEILRPGEVTLEQLKTVLENVKLNPAVVSPLNTGEKPRSPGMKYKHYAPKTDILLIGDTSEKFYRFVNRQKDDDVCALVFEGEQDGLLVPYVTYGRRGDSRHQARSLFTALRRVDALGKKRCYAMLPDDKGIGLAVRNRLMRAADFRVIESEDKVKDERGYLLAGLTGKTGAGKTTVGRLLLEKGAAVIDCDVVAKTVVDNDARLHEELIKAFGSDILKNGVFDRKALAAKAFADGDSLAMLNRLTHPPVIEAVDKEIERCKATGAKVIVLDAAALIESKIADICDVVIAATAPEDIRLKRIIERDGLSQAEALLRINAQHADEFYESRADFLVRCYPPYIIAEEIKPVLTALGLD